MSCPRLTVSPYKQIVKFLSAALAPATGALLFATALSTAAAGQITCTTGALPTGNGEDLQIRRALRRSEMRLATCGAEEHSNFISCCSGGEKRVGLFAELKRPRSRSSRC